MLNLKSKCNTRVKVAQTILSKTKVFLETEGRERDAQHSFALKLAKRLVKRVVMIFQRFKMFSTYCGVESSAPSAKIRLCV